MASLNLVIVDGPDVGRAFEIAGSTVLGRDRSAGIVLDDAEVSRRHAGVVAGTEGAEIEDLGSLNGTWLNGERIGDCRALGERDRVRLGTTVLEVHLGSSPPATRQWAVQVTQLRPVR